MKKGGAMKLRKNLAISLIRTTIAAQALLLAACTGYMTPSPEPDLAAGWRLYANTRYGYTIRYPAELDIVKGPGADLPDQAFQAVDGISFAGMQKPGNPNSGVVFGITVGLQDANGNSIQCSNDEDCLAQWKRILGEEPDSVTGIEAAAGDQTLHGFESDNVNPLYSQRNRYFVFVRNGHVWTISLTLNGYSTEEIDSLVKVFDAALSTLTFQK
jgi:hypothetical protein